MQTPYLLEGLASGPSVVSTLLRQFQAKDYDKEFDSDRFTVREVVAHLADWEEIWRARAEHGQAQAEGAVQAMDEGERAAEQNYATWDVEQSLLGCRAVAGDVRSAASRFCGACPVTQRRRNGPHLPASRVRPDFGVGSLRDAGRPRSLSHTTTTGLSGRARALRGSPGEAKALGFGLQEPNDVANVLVQVQSRHPAQCHPARRRRQRRAFSASYARS